MKTENALDTSGIVPKEALLECISNTRLTPARNPVADLIRLFSLVSFCASNTKSPKLVFLKAISEFRAQHIPKSEKVTITIGNT